MNVSKTSWLFCALILLCSAAIADTKHNKATGSEPQCAQMLKECFSSNGLQRSNCFYTTAKHPFCEGTEIGKMIYERWTLAASTTVGDKTPPGLLGPSIYDESCIANCDNQWLGQLVDGQYGQKSLRSVQSCLDACRKENQLEILRP